MNELISIVKDYTGANGPLAAAYAVVSILVVIMAIAAGVMKVLIMVRYARANRMHISSGLTGVDAARAVLDRAGYPGIAVRKAGFWRELIFGNYYNVLTKTIYLRSVFFKIDDRRSVTSTAIAVQKAALAKLCEDGDRQALTRNRLSLIGIFGPFLFIPLLLLGFILDVLILQTGVVFSALFLGFFILILIVVWELMEYNMVLPVNSMALSADAFAYNSEEAREVSLEKLRYLNIHTGDEVDEMLFFHRCNFIVIVV